MSAPFLSPSVAALLRQVANDPTSDASPDAQRVALNRAMTALGYPAPVALPDPDSLPTGATVYSFRPSSHLPSSSVHLVYLHGGSFVAGGLESHAGIAQALADATALTVALVNYRLAPEFLLSAALDDCMAAVSRFMQIGPIVLVGDSAGGWLAIETALQIGNSDPDSIRRLVLINPMIGPRPLDEGSMKDYATGYFANAVDFAEAWKLAGDWPSHRSFPGGSSAALNALPPSIILTNEVDPVRDQGEDFAERLSAQGVPTLLLRVRGLVHAAWLLPQMLPEAQLLMAIIAGAAAS